MIQICTLKLDESPSSGIITVGEDIRDAFHLRETNVWLDDLREIRDAVDVRVETLPGMMATI